MTGLSREFTEGVWKVAYDRTSPEYPFIQFSVLVNYVQERFPHAQTLHVQAALKGLAESGRIDDSEGFEPTSEIKVLRS